MFRTVFQGLINDMATLRSYWNTSPLFAFLFVNDHIPTDGDVFGDYVEPTFAGYAQVNMAGFALPMIVGVRAVVAANPVQFMVTANGPLDLCFGWGIRDNNFFNLLGAERFDTPIPMQNAGNTILRYPVLTIKSET